MNGVAPLLVLAILAQAEANEAKISSKVLSASLFKNGLAFVTAEITMPQAGDYYLTDVPRPVHGTFWVETPEGLTFAVVEREVEEPLEANGNLSLSAAGQEIILNLKGDRSAVRGTLFVPKTSPSLSPAFFDEPTAMPLPGPSGSEYVIVDTPEGRVYVQPAEIVSITVPKVQKTTKVTRPVLRLSLAKEKPLTIRYHYLAKGLGWAPSYQVDISDPAKLGLRQSAVILNELADFADAELSLITGYPSIEFANVTSPLAPGTTWDSFLNQLRDRGATSFPDTAYNVAPIQQARITSRDEVPADIEATGDGVDLHLEPIGKRTLKLGETILVSTANQPADYERIVEWKVPPARQESGIPITRSRSFEDEETENADAWDALRFRNPLPFPLTTGPAMIVAGNRFLGQRLLNWGNPGETMVLRVNKALSVETSYVEFENELEQQPLIAYGRERYRKPTVTGKLKVRNGRREPITAVITGICFGEVRTASDNPTIRLEERSGYSINKRHELIWTILLPAGTEKEITYQYDVLVPQ